MHARSRQLCTTQYICYEIVNSEWHLQFLLEVHHKITFSFFAKIETPGMASFWQWWVYKLSNSYDSEFCVYDNQAEGTASFSIQNWWKTSHQTQVSSKSTSDHFKSTQTTLTTVLLLLRHVQRWKGTFDRCIIPIGFIQHSHQWFLLTQAPVLLFSIW